MDVYTVTDLPAYPFAARLGAGEGMRPRAHEAVTFANGNRLVRVEPGAGAPEGALIVAYARAHPGEVLVEAALVADALRRARGGPVRLLFPYLPYSRGNRPGAPGESFGARVFASLVDAAGADEVLLFDLHAPELPGFFRTPVRPLSALPRVAEALAAGGAGWDWVVAPDCGRYDAAMALARALGAEADFFVKARTDHSGRSSLVPARRPHLRGARVLLFDDEVTTGDTLAHAAAAAAREGAASIDAAVLYAFCAPGVMRRLAAAAPVGTFTTTNLALPLEPAEREGLPFAYRVVDAAPAVTAGAR